MISPTRVLRVLHAVFLLGAVLFVSSGALAQDSRKAECASAYETAQESRASGDLKKAREALVLCAQTECPEFVQTDCARWLSEVQKEMPSVVIAALDENGEETLSVKVTVDGEVVAETLDGTDITVDPGMRLFMFELEGQEPIERKVVMRQGQKNREIKISWAADAPPAKDEAEPPTDTGDDGISVSTAEPGPLRMYAYVAGGVGALGLVGFGVFGALASGAESDLKDECPNGSCPFSDAKLQGKKNAIATKALMADIGLGVGIAGLAGGVVLYFMSEPKSEDSAALHFDAAPLNGGGYATLSGAF